MNSDVAAVLAAQGLELSDLEMNRGGRVSERQLARQQALRRVGRRAVWLMATGAVVGCGVFAGWKLQSGDRGLAIFMAIFGLAIAALPLAVYYRFRFVDPEKLRTCAVTQLGNAAVGAFIIGSIRGVYAIRLDGKRYSGFATDLTRAHLAGRMNAYVVEKHAIVLALEPIT